MTKPILVFGDVMFDFFFDMEPKPDSHGVKVYAISDQGLNAKTLGGAGNVARSLIAMGESVKLLALVDGRAEMRHIASYLPSDTLHVVPAGRKWDIPYKFWHRLDGKISCRHDMDGKRVLSLKREERIIGAIKPFLRHNAFSAVVLSDYIKGTLSPKICSAVISAARELSIPVLVDTKRRDLKRFEGVSSIQVSDGFDRHINLPPNAVRYETRGSEGVLATIGTAPAMMFPSLSTTPINVIGAGDAFLAGCAKSIANGGTWADAAQWGNYAAKLRVETVPEQEIVLEKSFGTPAKRD